MHIFARAISNNRKLRVLNLRRNSISESGWMTFFSSLCDTSTVNNTFLSNHTLEQLIVVRRNVDMMINERLPWILQFCLDLNQSFVDKKKVAIMKILSFHLIISMNPLFEWELKMLPIAVRWFDIARSCPAQFTFSQNVTENIQRQLQMIAYTELRKLSAVYEFVRAMPIECVDGYLGKNTKKKEEKRARS